MQHLTSKAVHQHALTTGFSKGRRGPGHQPPCTFPHRSSGWLTSGYHHATNLCASSAKTVLKMQAFFSLLTQIFTLYHRFFFFPSPWFWQECYTSLPGMMARTSISFTMFRYCLEVLKHLLSTPSLGECVQTERHKRSTARMRYDTRIILMTRKPSPNHRHLEQVKSGKQENSEDLLLISFKGQQVSPHHKHSLLNILNNQPLKRY